MATYEPSGHLKLPVGELPPPLRSAEERLNYLEQIVLKCLDARVACDVVVPLKGESPAQAQHRMYRVFMLRHGSALGALGFALRTEMIEPEVYAQLTNEVRGTLMPTMAGHVPIGGIPR